MHQHSNDERLLLKLSIIGLIIVVSIFYGYLHHQGTKERSYSNVGETIYIGDEYRNLKYKDKKELESKLEKISSTKNIKVLIYIIKKVKHIQPNGYLSEYTKLKSNEVKIFLGANDGSVKALYSENLPTSLKQDDLNKFLEMSISQQLNLDLYDTAIWDICDYFNEKLN